MEFFLARILYENLKKIVKKQKIWKWQKPKVKNGKKVVILIKFDSMRVQKNRGFFENLARI